MARPGRTLQLSGERQSVGAARRFLADVVAGRLDDDRLDTATLLVTEVVTNVVLHARTDLSVHVAVEDAGVLVQVEDASPSAPRRRTHDEEAVTGRGLELVEGLADDFGVLPTSSGKSVWFTLGRAHVPGPSGWPETVSGATSPTTVSLTGVPLAMAERLTEHVEALLRDYELHCQATSADVRHAARVAEARRAQEIVVAAVHEAASGRGADRQQTVDVDLPVPPADLLAFEVLVEVLTDAERLADAGRLRTGPAGPGLTALRDWAIGEVVAQLSGGHPVAWPHRRGVRSAR